MRPPAYLTRLPGGATGWDLAGGVNGDVRALVRVLDMFVRQGLVSRLADREDSGGKRLVLAQAGRAQCALFHQIATGLEHENRAALPPESIAALITGLSTLLANPDTLATAPSGTNVKAEAQHPEQEPPHAP